MAGQNDTSSQELCVADIGMTEQRNGAKLQKICAIPGIHQNGWGLSRASSSKA